MKIVVTMIARNESHRFLRQALQTATEVAHYSGGVVAYTDDASTDNSLQIAMHAGAQVQTTIEPLFWQHEGVARDRAYRFAMSFCEPGDWILSLDADETINRPSVLPEMIANAKQLGLPSISMPLYEFWTPTQYRVDGFWFGGHPRRLFEYREGTSIPLREMACGSEPLFVSQEPTYMQHDVHLLHWGYVRPEDRPRKHTAYTTRAGGHGHNNSHVNSIISEPSLRDYSFDD